MLALSIHGLTKTYRNGVQALRGVDLDVEQGDFFALLGPNGAGKTTLIGIITSLVNKTAGTASVFGYDLDRELERAKSCIGVVPQELNFNQFETPLTIVINQAGFYGIPRPIARERAEKYLKQLQLWDKRNGMARGLSGGMKRRLMIARALMHEPRLLVLDEPTAGVDIEIRRSMWEFLNDINAHGTTIILTTHYLEEAEALCGRIAMLKSGRIVALDTTQHLLSRFAGLTVRVSAERLPDEWQHRIHRREGSVYYLGLESYTELERLLASFRGAGVAIDDLALAETDLEQVFLRIMAGSETTDETEPPVAIPEA
ncbi:MAG: ABC transporter ATP-binding protein [Steroidobacteraceae bacterium]